MLIYHNEDWIPIDYTDSYFQLDFDSRRPTLGYVFALGVESLVGEV
jgi:hypothetical protein